MQETWIRSLGWEDPLEEEMATHSSHPAWETHRKKSGELHAMGSQKSQTQLSNETTTYINNFSNSCSVLTRCLVLCKALFMDWFRLAVNSLLGQLFMSLCYRWINRRPEKLRNILK